MITHLGCWENTRKACKSLAFGSWYTSFSHVLPTSPVGYHGSKPVESVLYCLSNDGWIQKLFWFLICWLFHVILDYGYVNWNKWFWQLKALILDPVVLDLMYHDHQQLFHFLKWNLQFNALLDSPLTLRFNKHLSNSINPYCKLQYCLLFIIIFAIHTKYKNLKKK